MSKKIHLIISGKVQGVFYRAGARRKAEELGITGWVKNTSDGKVEVMAEGKENKLREIIKWCYNGSSDAIVSNIEIEWADTEKKFDKFEIIV